jgi:hypothetical protein
MSTPIWDDEDDCDEREIECFRCYDTGKVIAMDGYHEYLGYDYVPCSCREGMRWIGQLGPKPFTGGAP